VLEQAAPLSYQEGYDNAGLLTGNSNWNCTGILCTLDATEQVIMEAKERGCNLVVAHHPIIFGGLKKITGRKYVEKSVISAIKHDIAIYAIHTNLDNVLHGVNNRIADRLGLVSRRILAPKDGQLMKRCSFVPLAEVAYDIIPLANEHTEVGSGLIGELPEPVTEEGFL
ncbi:Nif3-like dinuclear metal center hexameric protein, partial [Acinetobacter baumannii]|nr:Nif3-like dinuclear metal center hexameric protein [Acinetobacter baumannii]